jgi:hypothetical protein
MPETNAERRNKERNRDIEKSNIGCLYYHEVDDETMLCTKCGSKFKIIFARDR